MIDLIFVMESRPSNKSDWMYIKSALDFYYKARTYGLYKIFAGTKSALLTQEKKIEKIRNCSRRTSTVILCADYDRESELNERIGKYAKDNSFELVWMNLDIEDVFLGRQIEKAKKEKEAISFQKHKDTIMPSINNLSSTSPLNKRHSTNLLVVCDKHLERK